MGLGGFLRRWRKFALAAIAAGRGAERLDGEYVSQAAPIVIVGCGRSGTTLLRVMLDSHPNICCGPESEVFLDKRLKLEVLAERFDMPPRTLARIYRRAGSRAEFIEKFFAEYCRVTGKPRWAEKSPRNISDLPFIFRAFPNARVLHIIRDGRDVACSLRTHPRHKVVDGELVPLNTWKPIDQCIQRWIDAIELARSYRSDPRWAEVRYEELVGHPREAMAAVLEFIGEPWDEAVLNYDQVHTASRDVRKFPQNPEATRQISDSSLDRWRRDLSDADKANFKSMAGKLLIELGYEADLDW